MRAKLEAMLLELIKQREQLDGKIDLLNDLMMIDQYDDELKVKGVKKRKKKKVSPKVLDALKRAREVKAAKKQPPT